LLCANGVCINIVSAPCLAAEQFRWSGKLDNISDTAIGAAVGAIVLSSKRIDALPADLKSILLDLRRSPRMTLCRSRKSTLVRIAVWGGGGRAGQV
jgi:hypothetical protein